MGCTCAGQCSCHTPSPDLESSACPPCSQWAIQHVPGDLWGSEGFRSRRLPAVNGDDCATLAQAGMCSSPESAGDRLDAVLEAAVVASNAGPLERWAAAIAAQLKKARAPSLARLYPARSSSGKAAHSAIDTSGYAALEHLPALAARLVASTLVAVLAVWLLYRVTRWARRVAGKALPLCCRVVPAAVPRGQF